MALILHIDAASEDRDLVAKSLQTAGHEVKAAKTGLEGISLAQEKRPDLVLLDMDLPDLDGYEVTLRLRGIAELDGVPVIAAATEIDERASLAVGADGNLKKPLDAKTLASTIEAMLNISVYKEHRGTETLRLRSQKIVRHLEEKVIELSEANRRLEELARLRREFLRNITHELATPLTPIMGYLRLFIEGQLGKLTPLQLKSLNAMSASTERLRFLIDTLLDMSHLETGRMHFYDRKYNFSELVKRAIEETLSRAEDGDVRIISELPSVDLPARGDSDKLFRAIIHVLDNAVKFTPPGGKIALQVFEDHSKQGRQYVLEVADAGPGVDPERIKKILEPFYQADGSPTRSHGGVGLGLAFAQRVTQGLGGNIDIQSPPDKAVAGLRLKGTCVRLWVSPEAPPMDTRKNPASAPV
ncbi:MAG: response regulator [Myxococcales bacterium]|nr:MAG: response regulator [Myxococcales bacterium]